MKNKEVLINEIISQWNPIGVPENIAKDEYKSYIPEIIIASVSEDELINCLENILANKMGLDYDSYSPLHKEEVKQIAIKILLL